MKKLYILFGLLTLSATAQTGFTCENPIVISSLPFNTADNTANYGDSYTPSTSTSPTCSTTTYGNQYHSGNDVIYAFTPNNSGNITVSIPNAAAWTGMFLYTSCANIGINYAACATGPSSGARTITDFAVTAGQTYYIFISSWSTPQTVAYTLNVTSSNLSTTDIQQPKFLLYPNPASSHISLKSETTIEKITIYNVNGSKCLEQPFSDEVINIEKLPTGFYLLEAQTQAGKFHKNFIKS